MNIQNLKELFLPLYQTTNIRMDSFCYHQLPNAHSNQEPQILLRKKKMKKLHGFLLERNIRRSIIPLISKQKTSSISIKTIFSVVIISMTDGNSPSPLLIVNKNKLTYQTLKGLQLKSWLLFPTSCPGNAELSSLCISPIYMAVNKMVRSNGQSTKMEHNRFSHVIRVHNAGLWHHSSISQILC